MNAIQTYTDTKCELEIARNRLNLLISQKEKLYYKFFPVTSKIEDVVIDSSHSNNDKMAEYLHQLCDIDIGNGRSLADEITYYQESINKLNDCINNMNNSLSRMSGIEYQLYYEIIVRGTHITKTVEKIAEKNNLETRTIWRRYYASIKKYIKKIKDID